MLEYALILPAGGLSTRFGNGRNKLLERLDGIPVIVRSLTAFLHRSDCRKIIIPTSDLSELKTLLEKTLGSFAGQIGTRIRLCLGGENRAQSVKLALLEVDADIEWIAVHDAARPLLSANLLDRTLLVAEEHGAAAPVLPVNLTIKQAAGSLPAPAKRTIPRNHLWAMQTPQIMRRRDLLDAYANCPLPLDQITDDAQLLESIGKEIWLLPGDERNLKITTRLDMIVASALLTV